MVQLDHDEEMWPTHGMYGTLLDDAFGGAALHRKSGVHGVLVSLQGSYRSYLVFTLTTRVMDGLWRGEMRCIGPRAKEAD